jgi:hypothetical protein
LHHRHHAPSFSARSQRPGQTHHQTTNHQKFLLFGQVTPGSHSSELAVNKQLNDKERVCAALENPNLLDMVDRCLAGAEGR